MVPFVMWTSKIFIVRENLFFYSAYDNKHTLKLLNLKDHRVNLKKKLQEVKAGFHVELT